MEHTAAAPSRARGYQSGTSRHIERADPEMVRRGLRVSAAPDPRDRPVAIRLSTGIFSARAASPRVPRASTAPLWAAAKDARGRRGAPRDGSDRPRPPPTDPGPAPGDTPRLSDAPCSPPPLPLSPLAGCARAVARARADPLVGDPRRRRGRRVRRAGHRGRRAGRGGSHSHRRVCHPGASRIEPKTRRTDGGDLLRVFLAPVVRARPRSFKARGGGPRARRRGAKTGGGFAKAHGRSKRRMGDRKDARGEFVGQKKSAR